MSLSTKKRDHSLLSVGLKTKVMDHFVSHKHCPFRSTIKEALLGHKCPITLCHTLVVTSLKGAMKSFNLGMATEVVEEITFP